MPDNWRAGEPLTGTFEELARVVVVSANVFQAWQSGQRPIHLGLSFPHSLQTKIILVLAALTIYKMYFILRPMTRDKGEMV
jgi:hypothetical protein